MFKKLRVRIKYHLILRKFARAEGVLEPSIDLVEALLDALPPSMVATHYNFKIGDHFTINAYHKNVGLLKKQMQSISQSILYQRDVKSHPEVGSLTPTTIEHWLVDLDGNEVNLVDAINDLAFLLKEHRDAFDKLSYTKASDVGYYTRRSQLLYEDLQQILIGVISIILGDI